jgi:filamentous hemagglutinin
MVGSAQGSGLLPAQEFVNRNGMLYDSPLGGAVYGGLRTVGVNDNTARAFGALGNSVEMAGAVATGAPFAKPRTVNVVGVNNAAVVGDAVPTLGPGWSVTAPRGLGSATGPLPPGYTTVSRWVSPDEAATWMQNGGTAIPTGIGAGNRVYVTALDAAKPGGTGPIRIDFAVPEKALSTAGKPEWFQMFQPMPSTPVYNVQIHVPPGTVIPKVK